MKKKPNTNPFLSPLEGNDIYAREGAWMNRMVNQTIYCMNCGKELIAASTDENKAHVDWETERKLRVCTKCQHELYRKFGGYR